MMENFASVLEGMGKVVENIECSRIPEKLGIGAIIEKIPEKLDHQSLLLKNYDVNETTYFSTWRERLAQTPAEYTERGIWEGQRGESKFMPSDGDMKCILQKFKMDGVTYKNAIPDFSNCSEQTLKIDHMTENRRGIGNNFDQCDHRCAEIWSNVNKDGKSEWTPRDVQQWRQEMEYSWHERNDMETCDLIPTKINDYFGHLGGVSECRKRDSILNLGDEFDE